MPEASGAGLLTRDIEHRPETPCGRPKTPNFGEPKRLPLPHAANPHAVTALAYVELRGIFPLMSSPNNIAQLPRMKPGRRGVVLQALDMQRVLVADALNPKTTPSARAQVARTWEVLEERKQILRMKPKPKDVEVERKEKKLRRAIFTE